MRVTLTLKLRFTFSLPHTLNLRVPTARVSVKYSLTRT